MLLAGFNNKHYDNHIMKAILLGGDNEDIKSINDFIINGFLPWEHPFFANNNYIKLPNTFDVKDDMQLNLSLKSIEAHLGLPIKESTVNFNIDRPLTDEELTETVEYCKYDVDMVSKLVSLRKRYLETKIKLGEMRGISAEESLYCTNAKIVAKYLLADRIERNDGREYEYPPNLKVDLIPNEILDFFETIHDKSIPDDELFKTKLDTEIGGCPIRYAWGGVHGSMSKYYAESDDDVVIQNKDVRSYYPALMIEYDYISRNIPSKEIFRETRDRRIEMKKNDDPYANVLKLPLNTTSGAAENFYNDLYDPKQARGMRISGQLFLTELVISLIQECKSFKLINLNTDGFMYTINKNELKVLESVCKEWETRTKFELETDHIKKVWIKDVNNLLFITDNGKITTVGGYLNYGTSDKAAWGVNNNHVIVKKAVIDYFTKDIPVEDTINNCDDILQFQIISNTTSKYSKTFHVVNGERVTVQRVNRVYATADKKYGTLYKVHAVRGNDNKVAGLPLHCIVDNNNELSINDIDKSWYIQLAKKYINDFLGEEPKKKAKEEEKSMAETKTLNIYQKLIEARNAFLDGGVKKSGMNYHLEFEYFELKDIVPQATRIFKKLGLVHVVRFTSELATLTLVNCDRPEETIEFTSPMVEIKSIVSNTGKLVTSDIQALGSIQTYLRRYLYLVALDIVESDSIDSDSGNSEPQQKEEPKTTTKRSTTKKPATVKERQEIKKELVDADGQADELQIKALKKVCKELLETDPSQEEFVKQIAVKTEAFTNVSKKAAESLITSIGELIKELKS